MSWRKFDTIYVNGCSHTAGGGLYDVGTKELYKEISDLLGLYAYTKDKIKPYVIIK